MEKGECVKNVRGVRGRGRKRNSEAAKGLFEHSREIWKMMQCV
jgi:hypothetical protein